MLPLFFYAQTMDNNDLVYKKLYNEMNFSKSKRSDIVWERIHIPDGKELRSFEVTSSNELYIGCNDGVYKYLSGAWDFIGLENQSVVDFEQSENGDLFIASNDLYSWDGNSIQYLSDIYTNPLKYISGKLFGFNGEVIRSLDNGITWEIVYDISSAEMVFAFTSTTPDSIFMGTTNWVGEGGGVYLSTDGGDNWEPFGLSQHFVKSMAVDNNNIVYAGNGGHWETGQGGLYRYNYETAVWDTLHYYPYIWSIVFNSENHIFTGFSTTTDYWGGVMHSEDNGETWILDTVGIGNTNVSELQIDNNGFLYALTGYTTKKLYRTALPVGINEKLPPDEYNSISDLVLFPNPTTGITNIEFHINTILDLSFTVYDQLGRKIKELPMIHCFEGNNSQRINLADLKNGVYYLSISNNGMPIENRKLILMK